MFIRTGTFALLLCFLALNCNKTEPTTAPEEEEVAANTFTNPVFNVGPDPWVFQKDDNYYVTYTTGRNLKLIKTKKMSTLNSTAATSRVVWNPPASGMNSAEIWAPELHEINGTWYIYYAGSDGNNVNHRMWVVSNDSADPLIGTWTDEGEIELPDDKWAIDGSPVRIDGQWYFAWSGWEGDINVAQNIYLAKMDSPTEVSGERSLLIRPEADWETNGTNPTVTEGPQFITHEGRQFLFYSAGGCWRDGYSIGALVLETGTDPLVAANWSRLPSNPLFTSNRSGGAYGPGHNSFFKSPDGTEDWILYHANRNPGDGCGDLRSIRMQPFTWSAEGIPQLGTPAAVGQLLEVPAGE
jgi:GH43 family beta-xylosidase